MPVIIEFIQSRPSTVRQECGPYRVVEISDGGTVAVFDGFQPLTIATRTPAGKWVVNGLDGLEFDSFIVLPPRDQAKAELDALSAEPEDETA
jgi:hypothetical protein